MFCPLFLSVSKNVCILHLELTVTALLCGQVSVYVSAGGGRVDCEQSLILLCKVTARETQARERRIREPR